VETTGSESLCIIVPMIASALFSISSAVTDLTLTAAKLQEAYLALKKIVADGGKVLFVGTKPQVRDHLLPLSLNHLSI